MSENCTFLVRKTDEVGLMFMESEACLAYGEPDLPRPGLPLAYHLHLPVDLPWARPETAAEICAGLMEKTAYLGVTRAVLHPPPSDPGGDSASRRLADFVHRLTLLGQNSAALLLENIRENDLCALLPLLRDYSLHVCLDMGHVLGYDQYALAGHRELLDMVRLVHVSAPGPRGARGRHLPLTALDGPGRARVQALLRAVPETAVVMLELFDWNDIVASLPLLRQWLRVPSRAADRLESGE